MTEEVLTFIESRVEAQGKLAMEHMADPYWTDLGSGHNVGKDELRAYGHLSTTVDRLKEEEWPDAPACARAASAALQSALERYRANDADPDGYGAATFHTVIREFDRFCEEQGYRFGEATASRAPAFSLTNALRRLLGRA